MPDESMKEYAVEDHAYRLFKHVHGIEDTVTLVDFDPENVQPPGRVWSDADGKRYKNYMKPVSDDPELMLFAKWQENAAALSISGFTLGPRATAPAARDAKAATIACTLEYYAVDGDFYEVRWTSSLDGEWQTLKRWMAEEDGLTTVTVEIPDSDTGFIALVGVNMEVEEY